MSGSRRERIRKPSYIPARTFAIAVLDFLDVDSGVLPAAQANLRAIGAPDTKYELAQTVLPILDGATSNIKESQEALAAWFDSAMDRVSGWYKRRVAWITFLLSLLVTALANASTVDLVHTLWNDQALRQAFVEQAKSTVEGDQPPYCEFSQDKGGLGCTNAVEAIERLPIPLGWDFCQASETRNENAESEACTDASNFGFGGGRTLAVPSDIREVATTHGFGWFLTAVLLSFGSRFWFDALSKLVNIRLAGQKPSESDASNKK